MQILGRGPPRSPVVWRGCVKIHTFLSNASLLLFRRILLCFPVCFSEFSKVFPVWHVPGLAASSRASRPFRTDFAPFCFQRNTCASLPKLSWHSFFLASCVPILMPCVPPAPSIMCHFLLFCHVPFVLVRTARHGTLRTRRRFLLARLIRTRHPYPSCSRYDDNRLFFNLLLVANLKSTQVAIRLS